MAKDIESGGKLTSAEETYKQVSGSAKSTDPNQRFFGETATQANDRITQAYKDLQAKPILSQEQIDAGAKVQYVRTGAGGIGEYTVVVPPGYNGPRITKNFTEGILRPDMFYTTVNGQGGIKTTGATGGTVVTGASGTGGNVKTLPNGSYTIVKRTKRSDGGYDVTYQAADGTQYTKTEYSELGADGYTSDLQTQYKEDLKKEQQRSAYALIKQEFESRGLGALVPDLETIMKEGLRNSDEIRLYLRNTEGYKKRFAANQERIAKGLSALTPAEYIGLEDQYQNIMRNYGLPESYWTKDAMGTQAGFNKFIANDVSAAELEDRIATAQKRVINADVNIKDALRQFYPDITNADILAYTLDPTNALENIKRKVTAAEIGGAALAQGLATGLSRAEELAKYGVTKAQAQQGYGAIGEFLPTAEKLGDIYANQGLGAYDQTTAEAEVFGTAGAAEAAKKRKKLTQLEQAQFGGQAGTTQGALDRGRQGAF